MLAVALLPALLDIAGSRTTTHAQAPAGQPYSWHEDQASSPPGPQGAFPGLAEDPSRHEIVLIGSSGGISTTWIWDEGRRTWSALTPVHNPPAFAYDAAVAYDGRHVVAFGQLLHEDRASPCDLGYETWLWDGSDWRRAASYREGTPGPPGPRVSWVSGQFSYDPLDGGALLFGGGQVCRSDGRLDGCTCASNETWLWNGQTETWARRNPHSPPPGSFYGGVAYDGGEMVLFGNEYGQHGPLSPRATYVWKDNEWSSYSPAVAPIGNYGPALAYDPAINQAVLFGGESDSLSPAPPRDETWTWSAATHQWTLRAAAPAPPRRYFAGMATSTSTGSVLLYGGFGTTGPLTDTWESGLPVGSTTTTLSSSVNPSTLGQPVAFTARVTPAVPSRPPAGSVIFQDGTSQLGAATLDGNSTASLTTSTLALGGHTIAAAYTGDNEHLPSLSAPLLQGVVTSGGSSAPTVSQVAPSCGPVGVPVPATLRGSRLWNASVSIPGWRSTDARADLPGTSLTVTLPARSAGLVSLTVATAAGSALASFNYTTSCIPPTATPTPAPSPPPSPTLARARGTEHALRYGGLGTSGPAGGPPTSSGTPAGPGGSPASAGSPLSVSLPVVQPGAIPGSAGLTNPGVIPGHGDEERPEAARAEADVHAMVGWDSAMAPGGAGVAVLSCATLGRAAAMRRRRSWRPCPRQA